MIAKFYQNGKEVSIEIEEVKKRISKAKEDEIREEFNRDARVLEFVGGCTYYIEYGVHRGSRRLKSSSLDELYNMFKTAYLGYKNIPDRKCYFFQKTK